MNRLIATAEQTEKTRAQMEVKNNDYFAAWEKNVTNISYGIIRERSEDRRAEVTNRFHSVNARYEEAQAVVRPLINYFNDIRTALSVDLTAAGLESVRSIVTNADQNSRKVQVALGRLADELTASGTGMSSFAVGNPGASPERSRISVRSEISSDPPLPLRE